MQLKKILKTIRHALLRLLRGTRDFVIIDLRQVMKNFGEHDGELSTCALAFFLLISFIPVSLVIISTLSFFYESDTVAAFYLNQLKHQLPSINIDDLISIIDTIIYKKRYLAYIWIPFLFWWGSFVFDTIERGLEKAFRIEKSRKYWKAKIRHFIIIIGMAFFVLFLTFFSTFLVTIKNSGIALFIDKNLTHIEIIKNFFSLSEKVPLLITSITTLLMNTLFIFTIYRFVPPKKLNNLSIFKGALFASFSYEIVKSLFSYYITEINDYTSIFGSLNSIVILMIWIWYTCFIFIFGAEMAWVIFEKSERAHELEFED